jgi:predicted MFS family arabinose efflux permease
LPDVTDPFALSQMTLEMRAWGRALARPGPVVFATLFAFDSMARAVLATVIPLQAYRVLASERDVSALFTAVGWAGIAATLFIPALVRRFRPRRVYTLAAFLLIIAAGLLALGTFLGLVAGMLLRTCAAALLLNVLNLYIMAYVKKRDLSRSEPLRAFFSAFAWAVGPSLGPYLFDNVGSGIPFALSAACAVLLLVYFWWLRLEYGPALAPGEPTQTNPLPHVRRYLAQPRLVLAWLLNFFRETWWVTFFIYTPIYMEKAGLGGDVGGLVVSCGTAFLFLTPVAGWLARRFGLRRHFTTCFLVSGLATLTAAALADSPWLVAAFLVVAAAGSVSLDAVCMVPFLRAVRIRERPEMTMVFSLHRDASGLIPTFVFSILLTFFELTSVYVVAGAGLIACVWLARWIPRSM